MLYRILASQGKSSNIKGLPRTNDILTFEQYYTKVHFMKTQVYFNQKYVFYFFKYLCFIQMLRSSNRPAVSPKSILSERKLFLSFSLKLPNGDVFFVLPLFSLFETSILIYSLLKWSWKWKRLWIWVKVQTESIYKHFTSLWTRGNASGLRKLYTIQYELHISLVDGYGILFWMFFI